MHGHHQRRYSGLYAGTRIEGLASDEENGQFGASWTILDLPSLHVHIG